MPKRTIKRNTTSGTRKSAAARDKKKRPGRSDSRRKAQKTPAIIADSLYTVSLKPRPAIASLLEKSSKTLAYGSIEEDYERMYETIKHISHKSAELLNGTITGFDPYAMDFDLGSSISMMLKFFEREVLPKDWEYNVEMNSEGEYYLALYKAARWNIPTWYAFPVKPIVKKIQRRSPKLYDLYLKFIRCFIDNAGIDPWWYGGCLSYSGDTEMLRDNLENIEFDSEDEKMKAFNNLEQTIESYKSGEAFEFKQLIKTAFPISVEQLTIEIKKYPKKNILVKWMLEVCAFMVEPFHFNQYVYPELEFEEDVEGLRLEEQIGIIWDWEDEYARNQEDYFDSMINGIGWMDPVFVIYIKKDVTHLDFSYLKSALSWPGKIESLFHQYTEVIKKL